MLVFHSFTIFTSSIGTYLSTGKIVFIVLGQDDHSLGPNTWITTYFSITWSIVTNCHQSHILFTNKQNGQFSCNSPSFHRYISILCALGLPKIVDSSTFLSSSSGTSQNPSTPFLSRRTVPAFCSNIGGNFQSTGFDGVGDMYSRSGDSA